MEAKETVVITKMSVKNLGCKPGAVGETPLPLCHIYGKATHLISGEDKNTGSVWTALGGVFQGVNLVSGDVYRSGKLFLPGGIMELVQSAVSEIPKDSTESVQFAMEIRSVKAANPIGYSYQAVNLVAPKAQDELAELSAAIAERQKKLEAPKEEVKQPELVGASAATAGKKK